MTSKKFASGLGIDVHIRTTRIDNSKMSYSYISGTAIQIGPDVLEVQAQADGPIVLMNGDELQFEEMTGKVFAGSFHVTKSAKGKKKNISVYDLDLGQGRSIQVRSNRKTGMIFVDISGTFPEDTMGLLGSPHDHALLSRDGKSDLTGAWNTMGEDWQVNDTDPKLFEDKDRHPQYPVGCVYEADNAKSHLRRRLIDEVGSDAAVSTKEAEMACAHATGVKREFCIDDVIATNDLELAADDFYN